MSNPEVRIESACKDEYHRTDIGHMLRVDNTHNPDARRYVAHFVCLLYQGYAPKVLPTNAHDGGILHETYRSVILRYCVGRCKEGQGPSAFLDIWDQLGDHSEMRRRFTISLTTDIIGDEYGRVKVVQPKWVKPYNQVKKFARIMMWQQVQQCEETQADAQRPVAEQNGGKLRPQGNMTAVDKPWYGDLEKDGDFGVKDGVKNWSEGLEGIPRHRSGRPKIIRPSRPYSETSRHRVRSGPSPSNLSRR